MIDVGSHNEGHAQDYNVRGRSSMGRGGCFTFLLISLFLHLAETERKYYG